MSGLRDTQQKAFADGKKVEELFIECAERDGFICTTPTEYEDRWEHWDVRLTKDGKSGLVDVKKNKVIQKQGYTWIEFQTVDGEKGWILGDAHAIAIEKDDRFDLYDRVKVKEFVEPRRLGLDGFVFVQPKDLSEIAYHRYRRMGRLDIVYVVPFSDIDKFIMTTIYK